MVNRKLGILTFVLFLAAACGTKQPSTPAQTPLNPTPVPTATATPAAEAPKAPQTPEVNVSVDTPTRVIQNYTDELRTIVEPESKEKGKRDSQRERKIAEKVRQFFDFDALARMSLGRHWAKITDAQRREYRVLFISLIEESYLKKSRDIVGSYKISFGREEIKGSQAKVISRVARNDADVEIAYELHRNPRNWMIYNIVLDGVDLIRNYQTQFNRIIEQNSFNELLNRMRKKRDEIDKDVTL